jgi:hypothetical protein
MSWLFSQALVEEYSAENFWDGEPFAQLNVMPTQAKFWRNDKTMEFSNLSRFGLTLQLLTESHGEALLTWYLADFHAKTSAQQEKAQALKANEAECGKKWHGLLAKYDPHTHSWKTAQCSLLEDLEQSLETWPRWGSMRNGACYLRPMLVQTINENESGFWLTPSTVNIAERSEDSMQRRLDYRKKIGRNGVGAGCLAEQVAWSGTGKPVGYVRAETPSGNWPTPSINLEGAVMASYATPTSRAWKDNGKSPAELNRNSETLAMQAGGALNPTWVEWLMNWPMKWTELKNEYECNTQESAKSDFNTWLELSSMQFNGKPTQTPSRLQQTVGCGNNLREMPRKATRFRALEESHENKSMPKLQKYIHIQTGKATDVQPILRSQTSLGESWWEKEPNIGRVASGVSFRVDRLKAIGNGQVPLCAATAFELLRERLKE